MSVRTEADLAEQIAGAERAVWIAGGGTRGIRGAGARLETGGLAAVELYEPGALTLVVGAGTPVGEIEALLAGEGQRLAFEPMDHRGLLGTRGEPTIGGVVAANVSGPRRVRVGACRDHLLGVRYIDGMGRIIRNGGRVMKNVTGYDLVRLMAGSWGTLGVISQVALKVLPQVETEATVMIYGLSVADAVRVMAVALASPWEVSGAAFGRVAGEFVAMLRIEGFTESVAYRSGRLCDLVGADGDICICDEPAQSAALWGDIRDVAAFHGVAGDVWRLSVRPGQAGAMVDRLKARDVLLDWGGGLIWALVDPGCDLRARVGAFDGHATLVRGDGAKLGRLHPPAAPLRRIEAGLRARFDPRGIFNPGLMG